jgi:membrane-associated phospholipid phosphatase
MRMLCLGALALSVALASDSLPAQQDSAQVPARPPAMVTGGDLLKLAAAGAVTGLAYQLDVRVREATHGDDANPNRVLQSLERVGDVYTYGGAVGIGGALWVGGMMAENKVVATTGLRALESVFAAGLVTKTLKGVTGRARPNVAPHRHDSFEWGRGFGTIDGRYESFPSGHATIAFAFASAVTGEVARSAPQHTRKVAFATYGLASAITYSRLYADEHWLSDLTLGAGIGMVSGWAVTRWHATRPDDWVDRFFLRPVMSQGANGSSRVGLLLETR